MLERSFWLHASLASVAQRGYWGPSYPASRSPTESDIGNAAKLLTGAYASNRLYLVYHQEIAVEDAQQVLRWWRQHCPKAVQLVPTLVLRMYDKQQTPVFKPEELRRLVEFFKRLINASQIAVYDVYPNRDQGEALKILAEQYPMGLTRVGIQPDERIRPPFVAAMQDTWSGFCHGETNADWLDKGFGAETLRRWVEDRNKQSRPVAWDLIVVAWDYTATQRGGYPGYDDAAWTLDGKLIATGKYSEAGLFEIDPASRKVQPIDAQILEDLHLAAARLRAAHDQRVLLAQGVEHLLIRDHLALHDAADDDLRPVGRRGRLTAVASGEAAMEHRRRRAHLFHPHVGPLGRGSSAARDHRPGIAEARC